MGRACRGKERSDWQRSLQDCGAGGKSFGSPAAQPPFPIELVLPLQLSLFSRAVKSSGIGG